MKNKKGAATLYIVVGITIFLGIMTYVYTMTSNLQIKIFAHYDKIKEEYERDLTSTNKQKILLQLEKDINELNIPDEEETENIE